MVLGSAQYRRQSDEPETSGAEDEISLHSDTLHQVNLQDETPSNGRVQLMDSSVRYEMPSGSSSCCRPRTDLERGLISLCLTLLAFCIILFILVIGRNAESGQPKKVMIGNYHNKDISHKIHVTSHKVCLTEECIKVSADILSAADFNENPCDDFYKYSCGGWEKVNPIPDGRTSWSMFQKLWEKNQLNMKIAIEEAAKNKTRKEDDAISKVVLYYESCMDPNGTIEANSGHPLLEILNSKEIGGCKLLEEYPVTEISDEEAFQKKFEYLYFQYQVLGFFSWSVGEDERNSTSHIIQIDQGGLSLPTREYYLDKNDTNSVKTVEAFKKMIVAIAKLLITDSEGREAFTKEREKKIMKQTDDIIKFETKLANITKPSSERRDDETLYNKMTVEEFQNLAGFLNWTQFLSTVFSKVNRSVQPDEEIIVYAPEYMKNLTDLIQSYMKDSEKRLVLENYMVIQLVKALRPSLSKPYRDAGKILEKALYGKESHNERWRLCIADTDGALGFALGSLFIKSAFIGDSKPQAQQMIDEIKRAFTERLDSINWMDNDTKDQALVKVKAMTDMIGYPDFILDPNQLNEYYKKLDVRFNDYFQNKLNDHEFSLIKNLERLDKPVNRTKWSMTPQTVNAYYTPTKNQIVFPAGMLQSPFFNLKYPRSLNFGAMGVVMGHELCHAFDDEGRRYDEKGNMGHPWNNKTLIQFNNRTSCMEKQYSSYHTDFVSEAVKGKQTLGENIADNGGLTTAYYAYKNWLEDNVVDEEEPLPGVNLTHHQLFFLSFAQVWCSVSTPQAKTLQIREDPHSPARFRVIGALSNSIEFAKAFNCPMGSRMNPKEKCHVW